MGDLGGLAAIIGTAALVSGQFPAAVLSLASAAECAAVTVCALRIPARERDDPVIIGGRVRLDWICLTGGVAGLVLLAVVRAPATSTAVSLGTDFIAYALTLVHFWRQPDEEPWQSYALYALSGLLALAAADRSLFVAIGYPAYLLAADSAGVAVIIGRRAAGKRARRSWLPTPDDPDRWLSGGLPGGPAPTVPAGSAAGHRAPLHTTATPATDRPASTPGVAQGDERAPAGHIASG